MKDQKLVFAEGAFDANCVLYIRNCEGCDYAVNVHSTKVMIEGCKNCRIALNGKIITNSAELWKCDNVEVLSNVKLAMQLDLSRQVTLRYAKAQDMVQLVWAGMDDMKVEFEDDEEVTEEITSEQQQEGEAAKKTITRKRAPHHTGLARVREQYAGDVNAELDQFIVRFVGGKLLEERIVRLANGFPTTDREADQFDAEAAKKDAHLEKMARDLIRENPQIALGAVKKAQEQKLKDPKKLKPNEPCHCGSKKKYKKCCADKDEREKAEQKDKEKKPERKFH